jgi:hypothetical protein
VIDVESLSAYVPWLVGLASGAVMVGARVLTNAALLRRREDILLAGSTAGGVSAWISALYLLGQVGLVIGVIWSFTIAWWGPVVPIAAYLLGNLVRSRVPGLTRELNEGPYRRCANCRTVRPVHYFAIDQSTADRMSTTCVACSSPDAWAFAQRLKQRHGL